MDDVSPVAASLIACFDASHRETKPFRHWLLDAILPASTCEALDALPVAPPRIVDTLGKRETHNSARLFFGREQTARHAVCADLAAAFQSRAVTRRIGGLCDVALPGASLRIESCLDTERFWLEPHTDIGAKLFTMLVYLSNDPGCEAWGTDILDANMNLVASAPYRRAGGLIFIPAADTWHGFHRRPIRGVRRSLIINYVKPEWRARHELAYPDEPVAA